MAYQSLYRAYRPQTFSDMVGQPYITRALKNQAAQQRVAHAYLFCGSRGTGKTSAARIMAMAINCERPVEGDPCLTCESCKALSSETTLDVFEMDAASNSRVEEIREMLSRTDYPPQFVKYKVYIIDEVHMLSNAAFNALLKTLEEPPAYMVFILATTEPQKLPATILSRCQRYDFGRISEEEIIKRLKMALNANLTAEDGALALIAATAQGSMRDAWSLMDMCLGTGDRLTEEGVRFALGAVSQDFLFDFLDALLEGGTARALTLTDSLMKGGRDAQVFLREFNAHVRTVLAVKWTGKGLQALTPDQLARLSAQAKRSRADSLLYILEQCMLSEQESRWSSSPRAVLELLALRASGVPGARRQTAPVMEAAAEEPAAGPLAEINTLKPVSPPQAKPAIQTPKAEAAPAEHQDVQVNPGKDEPQAEEPMPAVEEKEQAPAKSLESLLPQAETGPAKEDTSPKPQISPKDAWNRMLKRLEKESPGVFAMLSRGKYGGYQDKTFHLVMGKEDSILASMLNEGERYSTLARLLSDEMGEESRFSAGLPAAARQAGEEDEHLASLAAVFGRDKIVLKNN